MHKSKPAICKVLFAHKDIGTQPLYVSTLHTTETDIGRRKMGQGVTLEDIMLYSIVVIFRIFISLLYNDSTELQVHFS